MNVPSMLGVLGTGVGLIRAVPQLVRLLRAREAFGVSADTAATSSVVSFGWVAYGYLTGQPFVTFATGSSGLIFALVTFFALRFGRPVKDIKIAPIWLALLFLAYVLAGAKALGVILPISVLAANIPQILTAHREDTLTDLSIGTWLLSLTDGLVWGAYALLRHEGSILVYAVFQLTTSGLIVAFKLTRGKGTPSSMTTR